MLVRIIFDPWVLKLEKIALSLFCFGMGCVLCLGSDKSAYFHSLLSSAFFTLFLFLRWVQRGTMIFHGF